MHHPTKPTEFAAINLRPNVKPYLNGLRNHLNPKPRPGGAHLVRRRPSGSAQLSKFEDVRVPSGFLALSYGRLSESLMCGRDGGRLGVYAKMSPKQTRWRQGRTRLGGSSIAS